MYLVIVFVSPLYLALRQKWGAFVLNGFLYLMAWLTILFGVGVIFWALAVGHASWHLRKELMVENAEILAAKMAEKMHFESTL